MLVVNEVKGGDGAKTTYVSLSFDSAFKRSLASRVFCFPCLLSSSMFLLSDSFAAFNTGSVPPWYALESIHLPPLPSPPRRFLLPLLCSGVTVVGDQYVDMNISLRTRYNSWHSPEKSKTHSSNP